MVYKIDITGMHCSGCSNLIEMSLEDIGFTDIKVSLDKNNAIFTNDLAESEIKSKLDGIFANPDLAKYSYTNLTQM